MEDDGKMLLANISNGQAYRGTTPFMLDGVDSIRTEGMRVFVNKTQYSIRFADEGEEWVTLVIEKNPEAK